MAAEGLARPSTSDGAKRLRLTYQACAPGSTRPVVLSAEQGLGRGRVVDRGCRRTSFAMA
ncbi:hypothetical protein CSW60_22275 [Caulobacter sp. X]|nr:hypothetical protein CSW60_22275 [Caulobacter sp. X]